MQAPALPVSKPSPRRYGNGPTGSANGFCRPRRRRRSTTLRFSLNGRAEVARRFAQVHTAIWRDEAFTALTCDAQRLYLYLLSQDDLTYCGVLPLRVQRWADEAHDATPDSIKDALRLLVSAGYVAIDHRKGEVLLRDYIESDGILAKPQMALAALRALDAVRSDELRADVLARHGKGLEMTASRANRPGKRDNPLPVPVPVATPSAVPAAMGSGAPIGEVWGVQSTEPCTTTSFLGTDSIGAPKEPPTTARRGGRRTPPPEKFELSLDLLAWVAANAPNIDPHVEAERMLDWARGKGERKADWIATYRNWVRRASADAKPATNSAAAAAPARSSARNFTPTAAQCEILDALPPDQREAQIEAWMDRS